MSAYPNIADPMLGLSAAERRFMGRLAVGHGRPLTVGASMDLSARKSLQLRGLIEVRDLGFADSYIGSLTEKGRAVWEGRKA